MKFACIISMSLLPVTKNQLESVNHYNREYDGAFLKNESFWGKDGFSFNSIVDALNPLQNIPVVSNIYRAITGDETEGGSKLLGGAIFGGALGFVTAFFNDFAKEKTGNDIAGNIYADLSEPNISKAASQYEAAKNLESEDKALASNRIYQTEI